MQADRRLADVVLVPGGGVLPAGVPRAGDARGAHGRRGGATLSPASLIIYMQTLGTAGHII